MTLDEAWLVVFRLLDKARDNPADDLAARDALIVARIAFDCARNELKHAVERARDGTWIGMMSKDPAAKHAVSVTAAISRCEQRIAEYEAVIASNRTVLELLRLEAATPPKE